MNMNLFIKKIEDIFAKIIGCIAVIILFPLIVFVLFVLAIAIAVRIALGYPLNITTYGKTDEKINEALSE